MSLRAQKMVDTALIILLSMIIGAALIWFLYLLPSRPAQPAPASPAPRYVYPYQTL